LVILEFAELSKSGLSGVGSVGYANTDAFTILNYRPNLLWLEQITQTEDAEHAHALLKSGAHIGKILLQW